LHPAISAGIKQALVETYEDVLRNHTLQMAAALSYYVVLSLFPAPDRSVRRRGFLAVT
jgi:uncharacterized BrkB/YihY/UPF0761 family membrane protein